MQEAQETGRDGARRGGGEREREKQKSASVRESHTEVKPGPVLIGSGCQPTSMQDRAGLAG